MLPEVATFEQLHLTGKILGEILPIKLIIAECLMEWKPIGDVELVDIGNGFYLIKSLNVMDRNSVLHGQPWFVGGQPFFGFEFLDSPLNCGMIWFFSILCLLLVTWLEWILSLKRFLKVYSFGFVWSGCLQTFNKKIKVFLWGYCLYMLVGLWEYYQYLFRVWQPISQIRLLYLDSKSIAIRIEKFQEATITWKNQWALIRRKEQHPKTRIGLKSAFVILLTLLVI